MRPEPESVSVPAPSVPALSAPAPSRPAPSVPPQLLGPAPSVPAPSVPAPSVPAPAVPAPAGHTPSGHTPSGRSRSGAAPRRRDAHPATWRDAHLDNAKFFGVILVVCGHVLEDLRDVRGAHALYLFVYMFHMPLFIVLAGYFSRSFGLSAGKARKLVAGLVVPYVIFETAFAFYRWLLGDVDRPSVSLLDPYFVMWFLVALFAWRLSTPLWQQIRWPVAVAVVISVLSGTADLPTTLDLYRMLGLLPFFVAGLMLKPEHFALLRRPRARLAGALVLAGGLGTALLVHRRMTTEWALWRVGFADLGVSNATGAAMRLGMLLAGATLVAAFVAVVPARRMWFTKYGGATMYAYLLHGFGTKLAETAGWYHPAWLHTPFGVVVAMATAAGFAVLLMTAPVRRATRWAVAPSVDWAFTRRARYA